MRDQHVLCDLCIAFQRALKKRNVLRGRFASEIKEGDHLVPKIFVEHQGMRIHQDARSAIRDQGLMEFAVIPLPLLGLANPCEGPIFEVHISNIHARDELQRHSKLSSAVTAVIAGLGPYSYIVAMQAALHKVGKLPESLPAAVRVGPK